MTTTMFFNGVIYTMNPDQPRAQAIAVRDGRVLAVGSEGKVHAATGGRAEGINLRGRVVIPALTDAHVHLVWHALGRREVRLEDVDSFDAALQRIKNGAERMPKDGWILGGGWDHTRWGGRWPTAADLDELFPDQPVLLVRKDGHSAWVNSRALAIAGVDNSVEDPPGGSIRREQGQPTGLLFENAIDLVRRYVPDADEEYRLDAIRDAIAEAHSYGMVGMHIPPGLRPDDASMTLADVQKLRARDQLTLRCLVHLGLDRLEEATLLGLRSGLGDRWVRIGGVKMFADGSLGSETAEMLAPYEGSQHRGTATMMTDDLNDAVQKCISNGLAVTIHAIGDGANRRVLNAIEAAITHARVHNTDAVEVNSAEPATTDAALIDADTPARLMLPNRIEHAQIVHPRDMARFAQLGIIASVQPVHATSDMDMAEQLWGKRCEMAYAWHSLKNAGATLAFGSDAPVESLNPWWGIHAAVTRQRRDGTPDDGWRPEQCLSVDEAIRGFTIGAAMAAGSASEQGTLQPQALADMAVLSADPFKVEPSELHAIRSEMTILEGEIVWEDH
ncbi:MAG: amidohydrolase [Chloroflexi bacterium AL-W]|nr:amidohydrolase [Chloroflexi bacterium AL-N1]NOK65059.1 amidohydrolase [Chloroflexi bacterium AL-N10]NOK72674.1 amidohydrolase [Chloroflexi bacterium AL-N5]NOK79238.1 amidohydrolase [Chloroflexi bacterium AL-W]NOK87154.1 amidohydrolase [Chloroflexi bacterium AL-N15]